MREICLDFQLLALYQRHPSAVRQRGKAGKGGPGEHRRQWGKFLLWAILEKKTTAASLLERLGSIGLVFNNYKLLEDFFGWVSVQVSPSGKLIAETAQYKLVNGCFEYLEDLHDMCSVHYPNSWRLGWDHDSPAVRKLRSRYSARKQRSNGRGFLDIIDIKDAGQYASRTMIPDALRYSARVLCEIEGLMLQFLGCDAKTATLAFPLPETISNGPDGIPLRSAGLIHAGDPEPTIWMYNPLETMEHLGLCQRLQDICLFRVNWSRYIQGNRCQMLQDAFVGELHYCHGLKVWCLKPQGYREKTQRRGRVELWDPYLAAGFRLLACIVVRNDVGRTPEWLSARKSQAVERECNARRSLLLNYGQASLVKVAASTCATRSETSGAIDARYTQQAHLDSIERGSREFYADTGCVTPFLPSIFRHLAIMFHAEHWMLGQLPEAGKEYADWLKWVAKLVNTGESQIENTYNPYQGMPNEPLRAPVDFHSGPGGLPHGVTFRRRPDFKGQPRSKLRDLSRLVSGASPCEFEEGSAASTLAAGSSQPSAPLGWLAKKIGFQLYPIGGSRRPVGDSTTGEGKSAATVVSVTDLPKKDGRTFLKLLKNGVSPLVGFNVRFHGYSTNSRGGPPVRARQHSPPAVVDADCNSAAQRVFGYTSLTQLQSEVTASIEEEGDVLVRASTGAGKTAMYAVPAVMNRGEDVLWQTTIVFSPILSLMLDQALSFIKKNIAVAAVCGTVKSIDAPLREALASGKVEVLILTPEKLRNASVAGLLLQMYREGRIARFVVDEVHCASSWGRSFRPSYLDLKQLRVLYSSVQIIALSATLPEARANDVIGILGMCAVATHQGPLDRANLRYLISCTTVSCVISFANLPPVLTLLYYRAQCTYQV
jgi:hypothetical protein